MEKNKLVIIGAGPAGLACAIAATRRNLPVVLMDKGNVVESIIRFPVNMTFFSTPEQLEIGEIPFSSSALRPTRSETIRYYHRLADYYQLPFLSGCRVNSVVKSGSDFTIDYMTVTGQARTLAAENVVIATGFFDNPNLLGIPGEDLPHVSHYYQEPFDYFGKNVVIVGGKNSAVEAALDLHRHGAKVTMVHRKSELKESIKYWVLPDILNRITEGSIDALLDSRVERIRSTDVAVVQSGKQITINADAVLLLTGYHPSTELLRSAGAVFLSLIHI